MLKPALDEIQREWLAKQAADPEPYEPSATPELDRLFYHAPSLLAVFKGPVHTIEFANNMARIFAGGRDLVGLRFAEALPELVEQGYLAILDEVFRSGEAFFGVQHRMDVWDTAGAVHLRVFDFVYTPIKDEDGKTYGVIVHGVDTSAKAASEAALRLSEERFRLAQEAAGIGVWDWDLITGQFSRYGESYLEWGFRQEELGASFHKISNQILQEDRPVIAAAIEHAIASGEPYECEFRMRRPEGALVWLHARGRVVRDEAGQPVRMTGVTQDVTAKKKAADLLAAKSNQQRAIATLAQTALEDVGADELFRAAVPIAARTARAEFASIMRRTETGELRLEVGYGWDPQLIGLRVGKDRNSHAGFTLLEGRSVLVEDMECETRFSIPEALHQYAIRSGITVVIPGPEGPYGVMGMHSREPGAFSAEDADFLQAIAYLLSTALTRRAHLEALAQEREYLRIVLDNSEDAILAIDQTGTIRRLNAACRSMFGFAASEIEDRPGEVLFGPESWAKLTDRAAHDDLFPVETKLELILRGKDGAQFPAEVSCREILIQQPMWVVSIRDVSERQRAEERLRHAQKMEAVGQLTGGLAHDFNNLLTVVLGNAEQLAEDLAGDPEQLRMAELVRSASIRGAELIKRLLAFSRRQPLSPEPIDVALVIHSLEGLVRRTLGEHIEIAVSTPRELWQANADPAQVETALLNLLINARDAMPNGGTVRVSARNVRTPDMRAAGGQELSPGEYVVLSVSDTGTGMPSDVVMRACEPFFTTKQVGRGSGLGLSMVYGFAKQSGGTVNIESTLGHGTTVEIFLPRAPREVARLPGEAVEAAPIPLGNGRVVLVVEDEPAVREFAVMQIRKLGYDVIEAPEAESALTSLETEPRVDIMFSDVVMPGMSGLDLARRVRQRWPHIKVLMTSGFNQLAAESDADGSEVLAKPYTRLQLATALEALADQR